MVTTLRRYVVDQAGVVDAAGGNYRTLAYSGLTVRMDSSWSPYIQATLVAKPPTEADLTAMDPRAGWRAAFRIRSWNAANEVLLGTCTFASLGIRSRSRTYSRAAPGLSLELASDEARLQDFVFGYGTGSGGVTRAATAWAQDAATAAGLTLTVAPGAPDPSMGSTDTGWNPDVTAWDYISGLAEAAGARVYVSEANVLIWAAPLWTPDTATRDLVGISEVVDVVSRDAPEWANYAVVVYSQSGPSYLTSDGAGSNPRKGLVLTRNRRQPAGNAATKVRTTAQARGRNLAITCLIDLACRPNQRWRAIYQGNTWTGTVQSLAWNLPQGTMNLILNVIE